MSFKLGLFQRCSCERRLLVDLYLCVKVWSSLYIKLQEPWEFGGAPQSHRGMNQSERGGVAEGRRGQPECFHGDWVSAMPLRGQRSLTRRSICHAASGGSQSREREAKKRGTNQRRGWRQWADHRSAERRRGQVKYSVSLMSFCKKPEGMSCAVKGFKRQVHRDFIHFSSEKNWNSTVFL